MNIIRVLLAPEFRGEDVALLAMNGAGVTTFVTALRDAEQRGSSELEHDEVTHQLVIQAGAADIELGEDRVVWRLARAKAVEIVGT
jgi:ATPase subunit of ABC transporter with duplicated ATPase domains